jgi:hypothetical protein
MKATLGFALPPVITADPVRALGHLISLKFRMP